MGDAPQEERDRDEQHEAARCNQGPTWQIVVILPRAHRNMPSLIGTRRELVGNVTSGMTGMSKWVRQ